MQEGVLVPLIVSIIALLLLAAITAMLLKRFRFPYTIGLVIAGLLLGYLSRNLDFLHYFSRIKITPDIVLYVLLPTLVFDAAINLDSRLLMNNMRHVMTLAVPGLLIATAITGTILALTTPLALGHAMLFGGLISATDPVAVIALFKELGAPKRLTMLVDGESLFNDATAIVAFQIVLGIIIAGVWSTSALTAAMGKFLFVFFGGGLIGAATGFVMVQLIRLAKNDPMIEVTISTIVAYVAFIAANYYLELSGVMAAVGAGMVFNWYGSTRFTPEVKDYLRRFWEYASFAANSFIFLLIGLTENYFIADLVNTPILLLHILFAIIAVLLARAVVVYGLVGILNRTPKSDPVDIRTQTVMFWGGLRGALPIALAASLTMDFPYRSLIIELTCGIVLFTLLVQGTTIKKLISLLGLDKNDPREEFAALKARSTALKESIQRLNRIESIWPFDKELVENAKRKFSNETVTVERTLHDVEKDLGNAPETAPVMLWSQALGMERSSYRKLFDRGFISSTVVRELEYRNDLQRDHLIAGRIPPPCPHAIPLYVRLAHVWVSFLERIHKTSVFVTRHRVAVLSYSYEKNIAMLQATSWVLDKLDHIAELSSATPDAVETCRKAYTTKRDHARERVSDIENRFPSLIHDVMSRTLDRAALNVQLDVLDEFSKTDTIPAKLAHRLHDELSERLTAIKHGEF